VDSIVLVSGKVYFLPLTWPVPANPITELITLMFFLYNFLLVLTPALMVVAVHTIEKLFSVIINCNCHW